MSRSSERRAQVEPLPALVAVAVVCAGLGLYAGIVEDVRRTLGDRDRAGPTLDRCRAALERFGVLRPSRLPAALRAGPAGWRLNVTLSAGDARWAGGPAPPSPGERAGGVERASELASVAAGGRARPGRIRVVVWR